MKEAVDWSSDAFFSSLDDQEWRDTSQKAQNFIIFQSYIIRLT